MENPYCSGANTCSVWLQTGSGKTLAYLVPVLQVRAARRPGRPATVWVFKTRRSRDSVPLACGFWKPWVFAPNPGLTAAQDEITR